MDDLAERAATELFRESGIDLGEGADVIRLAGALLGEDCFRYLPSDSIAGGAALCRVRDRWFIYLARTLSGPRLNHAIGHELGHYFCARSGARVADEELLADRIAGALCAPREAFLRAHRCHGTSLRPLAKTFTLSLAGAALRLGETTQIPTALVKADRVRKRGAGHPWPPDEQLCARLPVVGATAKRIGREALAYLVA